MTHILFCLVHVSIERMAQDDLAILLEKPVKPVLFAAVVSLMLMLQVYRGVGLSQDGMQIAAVP